MRVEGLAALAALALAAFVGGCAPSVTEADVFKPKPVEARAETVEQLGLDGAEILGEDVILRHGFIGEGDARTAWTLAERPGAERPLIVHCGGNASDRRRDGVTYLDKALPYGDVLLFDYPGYGDSTGEASPASMAALSNRIPTLARELARGRALVFWGHSLGGFVCAQLVRETPEAKGMIFEATARNVEEVAQAWTPWFARPFVRPKISESLLGYDSADALAAFEGQSLVLTAGQDETLAPALSRSLAAALAAQGSDLTVVEFPAAGHSDIPDDPAFPAAMSAFFDTVRASPP